MSLNEIKNKALENILVNFFCITIMMGIYLCFMGRDYTEVNSIFAVAIMSILTGFSELVLYSKRELRRLELLVRHIINVILGVVIVLSIAIFMEWVSWNQPILLMAFAGMVMVVHIATRAIDFYRTKLKTDAMTKKIRELNKQNIKGE